MFPSLEVMEKEERMSHHSQDPLDPEQQKLLDELGKVQKTLQGEFPRGRVNAQDEGALAMTVGHDPQKKTVFLAFAQPTSWIGFGPQQAMDLAASLVEHARACRTGEVLSIKL
jgi:hypothetical protein